MLPDTCVMCGEIVPEGRQVCPGCEYRAAAPGGCLEAIVTLQSGRTVTLYPADLRALEEYLKRLRWKKYQVQRL